MREHRRIVRRIAAPDEEIEKAVTAFIDGDSRIRKNLNQRVNDLDEQKLELQNDIDGLRAASRIPITKARFISWLRTFEGRNPADKTFQSASLTL